MRARDRAAAEARLAAAVRLLQSSVPEIKWYHQTTLNIRNFKDCIGRNEKKLTKTGMIGAFKTSK